VDETITSGRALRALIRSEDPKSYFGLRGGGIGWGIPGALGVKIALPDRPVVSLIGDGSALYSIQGIWTAARYRLAVVFVICNNRGYRILKERTHALKGFSARTGSYIGMDLEDPVIDFVGLAHSLGVPGERLEKIEEIRPALKKALEKDSPYLIDVGIDPRFKE
jgi:benzoylformate decarboxylase